MYPHKGAENEPLRMQRRGPMFAQGRERERSRTMARNTRGSADRSGQVREGMDVLDQNGEKIGKAGEMLAGGRYFNVDAGLLGMKEYYVPLDAVTEVGEDAVYLNVIKDRLGEMGWDRRPEEQTTRGVDVGGTTRTADVGRAGEE